MLRLAFVTYFILFFSTIAFSQWVNIPVPPNPMYPQYGTPMYSRFPQQVVPLANGKIMYCGSQKVSPSGSTTSRVYYGNDFGKLTTKFVHSDSFTYSDFFYATAYNDSVMSFDSQMYGNSVFLSTSDDFKNSYMFFGGNFVTHFNTIGYNYRLYTDDSLYFTRFKPNNAVEFKRSMPFVSNVIRQKEHFYFINDSVGFLIYKDKANQNKTVLIGTINRGNTWSKLYADSVNKITSCSFPSINTGFLTKSNGSILKTTNGGTTWANINSPYSDSITCVSFINDTLGYIGAKNGYLAKTENSGASWTIENTNTTKTVKSIFVFGSIVYFTTPNIADGIFKNSEKAIGLNELVSSEDLFQVFPNPSNGSIKLSINSVQDTKLEVELYDANGKKCHSSGYSNTSIPMEMDLSAFPPGMYYLTLRSDRFIGRKKLVLVK